MSPRSSTRKRRSCCSSPLPPRRSLRGTSSTATHGASAGACHNHAGPCWPMHSRSWSAGRCSSWPGCSSVTTPRILHHGQDRHGSPRGPCRLRDRDIRAPLHLRFRRRARLARIPGARAREAHKLPQRGAYQRRHLGRLALAADPLRLLFAAETTDFDKTPVWFMLPVFSVTIIAAGLSRIHRRSGLRGL